MSMCECQNHRTKLTAFFKQSEFCEFSFTNCRKPKRSSLLSPMSSRLLKGASAHGDGIPRSAFSVAVSPRGRHSDTAGAASLRHRGTEHAAGVTVASLIVSPTEHAPEPNAAAPHRPIRSPLLDMETMVSDQLTTVSMPKQRRSLSDATTRRLSPLTVDTEKVVSDDVVTLIPIAPVTAPVHSTMTACHAAGSNSLSLPTVHDRRPVTCNGAASKNSVLKVSFSDPPAIKAFATEQQVQPKVSYCSSVETATAAKAPTAVAAQASGILYPSAPKQAKLSSPRRLATSKTVAAAVQTRPVTSAVSGLSSAATSSIALSASGKAAHVVSRSPKSTKTAQSGSGAHLITRASVTNTAEYVSAVPLVVPYQSLTSPPLGSSRLAGTATAGATAAQPHRPGVPQSKLPSPQADVLSILAIAASSAASAQAPTETRRASAPLSYAGRRGKHIKQ